MSCYGYQIPTTPFLDSQKQNPLFTFFSSAYSSHTHTTPTIKLLLTDRNQYDGRELRIDDACSLFHILKYCKYSTLVISNQSPHGPYGSPVSAITNFADQTFYLSRQPREEYFYSKILDEQLISAWQKERTQNVRQFTLLHMMGAHSPYQKRYPERFAEHLDSAYDKAVYYVDSVIEKLFADIERNDSADVVIFIADHGEDEVYGHDSSKATLNMISIPLIVYVSRNYAEKHPELAAKIKTVKNKIFTNDLTFDFILDIMGIETSFTPASLHVLSPEYGITTENARTLHGRRQIDLNPPHKTE